MPVVTGGGTGSFAIDAELGVLTELQAGCYIFLDREYAIANSGGPAFEPALFVDASVVSAKHARTGDDRCGAQGIRGGCRGCRWCLRGAGGAMSFLGDEQAR